MRKAWIITLKDLRTTFGNRNLLLIMIAAPLLLSAIIGVTFGGVLGNNSPISDIPVAIVNLDAGAPLGLAAEGDMSINYGAILTELLSTGTVSESVSQGLTSEESLTINGMDTAAFTCPSATTGSEFGGMGGSTLSTLIDGEALDSADAARAAVGEDGYAVAVIIPPDFSANLSVSPLETSVIPSTIELYTDPERPIAAQIVRSIVDQSATQFATGNVTLAALTSSLPDNPLQIAAIVTSPAFAEGIACAFMDVGAGITVERQTAGGEVVDVNAMAVIGAGQALFFALFTANGQAASIINERRNWTLQRMLTTPTPAAMILLGKIMAVFAVVFVQVLILLIGLTLIASLMAGEFMFIWGNNLLALTVALFATSFAVAGIGSITAAVAKTEEQANTIGGIVAIFMAVFGGSFGFTLPTLLSYLSVVQWGRTAFVSVASGSSDFLLSIVALLLFGGVSFGIGYVLFRSKIADR